MDVSSYSFRTVRGLPTSGEWTLMATTPRNLRTAPRTTWRLGLISRRMESGSCLQEWEQMRASGRFRLTVGNQLGLTLQESPTLLSHRTERCWLITRRESMLSG